MPDPAALMILFFLPLFLVSAYMYFLYPGSRGFSVSVSEHLMQATVARMLHPRVEPRMVSGDRLLVIGADGTYESGYGGNYWTTCLEKWIGFGVSVTYLLTDLQLSSYPTRLIKLQECYPKGMQVILTSEALKTPILTPEEVRFVVEFSQKYATYHVTILLSSDRAIKAVWIEGEHTRGNHIANAVDFLSGQNAIDDPRAISAMQDFQRFECIFGKMSKVMHEELV